MKNSIIMLAVISGVLCGCVRSITTGPYRAAERNSGVIYSLPKTRLKVTVTYTAVTRTKIANGIPGQPTKEILIVKPIIAEPVFVPDTDNTFVLSGEGLVKDSRLDASFKLQVNDNQTLSSVSTDATDKSPEVFQGLLGTGISIAKMIVAAGAQGLPTPLLEIAARVAAIDKEIAALASGNDADRATKIKKLLDEETVLLDAAKRYLEANSEKVEEKDIVYTRVWDLSEFSKAGNTYQMNFAAPAKRLGDFNQQDVPEIKIELAISGEQMNRAKAKFFSDDTAKPDPAVIYRVPTPVKVKMTAIAKNVVIFEDDIPFAQIGAFNSVEAKYKFGAKRKTQILFSSTTGSVKEYGVESTSSAEAAAKALDTSLSKAQTAVSDIRKAQDAAEAAKKSPDQLKLADLEMQKKLVEAEAALLKAQQELQVLKK